MSKILSILQSLSCFVSFYKIKTNKVELKIRVQKQKAMEMSTIAKA